MGVSVNTRGRRGAYNTGSIAAVDSRSPDSDAARRAVLPAAVAGIAATTEPVFATGLAWLLLNQSLGAAQLAGSGLVVGGVVLAQFARRQ